ncbi:MAG: sulfur oxidation c-type cytochrome SoxX [Alphaproteobacteria bacterium]
MNHKISLKSGPSFFSVGGFLAGRFVVVGAALVLLAGCFTADDYALPALDKPLTKLAGNAEAGAKLMVNKSKGNCLACHEVSSLKQHPFHGNVGPTLDGIASVYNEGQLRQMIVNAKTYYPDTIMPAFHISTDDLVMVRKKSIGKTILEPQEVEDIVAYLLTQKSAY